MRGSAARSRGDPSAILSNKFRYLALLICRPKTHFLVKLFNSNRVLFRKIVFLILKFVKNLHAKISYNIVLLLCENLTAVPLSTFYAKTYFYPPLLSQIAGFSAIWQLAGEGLFGKRWYVVFLLAAPTINIHLLSTPHIRQDRHIYILGFIQHLSWRNLKG